MPGSVANAVPTTILPLSLSRAFERVQEWPSLQNDYNDGSSQVSLQGGSSRKRWRITKSLEPVLHLALRDFYDARRGGLEAFFFYDPWETLPVFSYDPTGAATGGRYTVRFEGQWTESTGLPFAESSIEIVELA